MLRSELTFASVLSTLANIVICTKWRGSRSRRDFSDTSASGGGNQFTQVTLGVGFGFVLQADWAQDGKLEPVESFVITAGRGSGRK